MRMKKTTRPSTAPDRKASAPAEFGIDQRRVQQHDRDDGAERRADPEAAVDDEIGEAAIARRHQFLDRRIDRGIFAADAGAGEEAEHEEARPIPRQPGQRRRQQIDRDGDEEQLLAPEAIGQPAEDDARRGPRRSDRRCRPARRPHRKRRALGLACSAPATDPASVTSRPSRIQVTPRATTTSLWKPSPRQALQPCGNVGLDDLATSCRADGGHIDPRWITGGARPSRDRRDARDPPPARTRVWPRSVRPSPGGEPLR